MKMKLENVSIPLALSPLLGEILKYKTLTINESGETLYLVPESWLAKVILLISKPGNDKMNKMNYENESSFAAIKNDSPSIENQLLNTGLPQGILDTMKRDGFNLIKSIMIFQGLSLKMLAASYGGASAAANLSNFMARPNSDLASMRLSTRKRIADALGCPVDWLLVNPSLPYYFDSTHSEESPNLGA